jgi:hypothetical protein
MLRIAVMMIAAGYLGSVALVPTVKWLWFLIGLLVYVPVVYALVRIFRQTVIGRFTMSSHTTVYMCMYIHACIHVYTSVQRACFLTQTVMCVCMCVYIYVMCICVCIHALCGHMSTYAYVVCMSHLSFCVTKYVFLDTCTKKFTCSSTYVQNK